MSRLISRDPFARTELHRFIWAVRSDQTCDNCGRTYGPVINPFLFRYATETDGGSRHWHKGLFCSKPCHDSYHG